MGPQPTSGVRARNVLRLGSKGAAVVDLQKHLQGTGFYKGKADGFFGPKTVDAVKHLQQRLKLVADGVVGMKTWAALDAPPPLQQVVLFTPAAGVAASGPSMAANAVRTFEIRCAQGPVVKTGTTVEYSIHQVLTSIISAASRYRFGWSAENDPATASLGLQATLQGPRDSRVWKLGANKPGVHRIKVAVMLDSSTSGSSLLENLVFEQTVTEDGRSLLHREIIKEASKPTVDRNVKEWTTADILRWKAPVVGDPSYIHAFKMQWVRGYREVLKAAAKRFDLPELLMGGVAYAEVGGDPFWIDGVAYAVRSFDHLADPVLERVTVTRAPELTSFGNLSTQVRRAADSLGYDASKLTGEQRSLVVSSLKNSRENIFIAAKHLADLRDVDFRGKVAVSMTQEDVKVTATRFNRGPDHSLDSIKKNMSYGQSILKRGTQILESLK